MYTYWTFTGQMALWAWFFGMPLFYGFIAVLLQVTFKLDISYLTTFITLLAVELVAGGLWLSSAGGKLNPYGSFFLSMVVIAGGAGLIFKSYAGDMFSGPISEWGKPAVVEGRGVAKLKAKGFSVELNRGEVFAAYGVSDVAEVKKIPEKSRSEQANVFNQMMTPLDNLQVDIVDNQFRISGFGTETEGLYIVVEGYISFISSTDLTMQDPEYRMFVHQLFELSKGDLERGYIDLSSDKGGKVLSESSVNWLVKRPDSMNAHLSNINFAIKY
ncbi:MAG: hypothetical protein ACQEV6_16600 [Pseudomonadota bacterium]